VQELVAWAKAHPDRVRYGTSGAGSTANLAAELFAMHAGIKLDHVPYKGAAAVLPDLLAGRVEMTVDTLQLLGPYIKSGKLRAIAFTGAKRWSQMPNVPTVSESGIPGFVVHFTWNAWFAPRGTPRAIVDRLQSEVHKAIAVPKVRDFFAQSGWEPLGSTPEALDANVTAAVTRSAEAARIANVHPE
jgi:tripartite-type tricarboxylate transporter receptor subunit TctC